MLTSSRRGFWLPFAAAGIAIILIAMVATWALHPASLKARIIAEVERATGRTMAITGAVSVELSVAPTLSINGVTLSNPNDGAGFSRPEVLKVDHVELSLALLPLLEHRFEISHAVLIRPDVLLETDANGHPNWAFGRVSAPAGDNRPPTDGAPGERTTSKPFAVAFTDTDIEDGRIGWRDGATGGGVSAALPHVTVTAPVTGGMQATGTVLWDGHAGTITASAKAPEGKAGALPITVRLESEGATLTADGHLSPSGADGFDLRLNGDVPNPKAFAASFPRLPLAALSGVGIHAEVGPTATSVVTITNVSIKANSVDLGVWVKGLRLSNVSLNADRDQPVQVSAGIMASGADAGVTGMINAPDLWRDGTFGPIAVDLGWNAASARGHLKGDIQSPAKLSGYALDLSADIPRPSSFLDGMPQALRSLVLRAHVTDAASAQTFEATSNVGDLAGTITVVRTPRPSVTGEVTSKNLDIDALQLLAARATPAPRSGGPSAPDKVGEAPLIGEQKFPFDQLRAADADLTFKMGRLRLAASDLRDVNGRVSAKDGVLHLEAAANADQPAHVDLLADATRSPPPVHLTVRAPKLPLRLVLAALGLPPVATGAADVRADLTASGDTPKSLASTATGLTTVAVEGGQVDARAFNTWLAAISPMQIKGGDLTELRCLAVRANAQAGVVSIDPLALNTTALILEGGGDVDLRNETLSISMRPRTKIGGTGIALPLRVTGPMRSPTAKADISPGAAGALAGLLIGGKDIMGAAGGGDPCPAALARAREPVTTGEKP
jgi:uncharacterized protein involved in outer membrane biogenesis